MVYICRFLQNAIYGKKNAIKKHLKKNFKNTVKTCNYIYNKNYTRKNPILDF